VSSFSFYCCLAPRALHSFPTRRSSDLLTTFHIGDLKGLLSEAHFADSATFIGERFNGEPDDDLEDMYPLEVWSALREYIYHNKRDRKSTRLNSSHLGISYAVFCLKKKK